MESKILKKRSVKFFGAFLVYTLFSIPDLVHADSAVGQKGLMRSIPKDRTIYMVSAATTKLIDLSLKDHVLPKSIKLNKEIREQYPNIKPDELDVRSDFTVGEIGLSKDKKGRIYIDEIVAKDPHTGLEVGIGLNPIYDNNGKVPQYWNGKLKIGYAKEWSHGSGAGEIKYGVNIDMNHQADDYYDGEWAKSSESRFWRSIEDIVSKLDFYIGGAGGVNERPGHNIGIEISWGVRERYSRYLFSDMNKALDELLQNQVNWEKKRHAMIIREAQRFGVDTEGKYPMEIISEIWSAWDKAKKNKRIERPFYWVNTHPKAMDAIRMLDHKKMIGVAKSLGITIPREFFGCLCESLFLTGVPGGYHPKPKPPDCNNSLPCKGGNWGCVAYQLPDDPVIWDACMQTNKLVLKKSADESEIRKIRLDEMIHEKLMERKRKMIESKDVRNSVSPIK